MDLTSRLNELITPILYDLGYDLVRVKLSKNNGDVDLQVMAEPLDGGIMSIKACESISRSISMFLDTQTAFFESFSLEVSSPGIDRPLVKGQDFLRFLGCEAKVELDKPKNGQRRFSGKIIGYDDGNVKLLVDNDELCIPHARVVRSKLVITDELLAMNRKG
mgnify:CR=1 FL=1